MQRVNNINLPKINGFSLLEVLVAVVVLAVGVLGLATLQLQGLKFGTDSYLRTQATVVATDLIDRMMANKVGADAEAYCISSSGPTCTTTAAPGTAEGCGDTGTGCTSLANLGLYDLTQWYNLQNQILPPPTTPSSIERSVVTVSTGITVFRYTITVRWQERDIPVAQTWVVDI